MRTTVDLPDDLHAIATSIARDSQTSLSETVARLMRAALNTPGDVKITRSEQTGLKVIHLGRTITSEDVRSLDDDE